MEQRPTQLQVRNIRTVYSQNKKTTKSFLIVALFTSRKVHFQTVKKEVKPMKGETKEIECQDMSTFKSILDDQKSDVRMMFNVFFSIYPSPRKKNLLIAFLMND